MVTREQLKDWLDVNARKKYAEKLEEIFDDAIKRNALKGITTFVVSTGRINNVKRRHEKTEFYSIWHTQDLSDDNREVVKREILKKYREHGFTVDVVLDDCGWGSQYEAVMFTDIHKAMEAEK